MAYNINGRQYEWADLTLLLGNRDITGFQGIEYTEKIERDPIFAKGRHAHSIQSGNVTVTGKITMLQSELETLIKAGNGSILNLVLNGTIGYGDPALGDTPIYDQIESIHFTETVKEMKQGDKFMPVTLPFVATRVKYQAA